jgi:hypothetical protein
VGKHAPSPTATKRAPPGLRQFVPKIPVIRASSIATVTAWDASDAPGCKPALSQEAFHPAIRSASHRVAFAESD